ncbi:MAG TPA: amino acid adenylation domain-containing protein [Thermoanaerobaculia bacterium]|nr:amino acid adenylation domain-containing protein [Thermoanaerobaculia bacterium]
MQMQSVEGFRLSPQQRRLWQVQQGGPSAAYRAQCALLLDGELDRVALAQALTDVGERHEVLRTAFQLLPGMTTPLQVVGPADAAFGDGLEFGGISPGAARAEVEELLAALRRQAPDPARLPLARAGLGALAPGRHLLVLDLPALLADAGSLESLAREIGRAYKARRDGSGIDGEPLQYVDLAEWQNELLEAAETEPGRAYWSGLDIAAPLRARLPGERSADDALFEPRTVSLALAEPERTRLAALAKRLEVGLPALLSAAWCVLLARLTGEERVLVGTAFDGRGFDELKDALGLFARCLPVVTAVPRGARFADLVKEVAAAEREAGTWQECFAWDLLAGTAEARFCPFAYEWRELPERAGVEDLDWSFVAHYVCTDRFRVRLSCVAARGELRTDVQYDASVCERGDAERLAARLHRLIEAVVETPEAAVGQLDLLPAAERRWLLVELNDTATDIGSETSIQELLAPGCARRPEATAVAWRGGELSYRELERDAVGLASHLARLGVGPDSVVGVCLPRGPEMVTGILGVLAAGGAYLPLDPAYPRERLAFMLVDSRAAVLVTDRTGARMLARPGLEVVEIGSPPAEIGSPPRPRLLPDHLAYVIYTSGSTGRPKGVAVAQRHLAHSIAARRAVYGEPVSAFLLLSSFAFDSSVAGLFWTLCDGGTLVLTAEGSPAEPRELIELIARHRVSHLLGLPSLYALLLRAAAPGQLDSLRTVIVAGEPCPRELVESHYRALPGAALWNEYGPTEATVWSSVARCAPAPGERVAIGRPIPNTRLYLLDEAGAPVPAGVPGELFVGGPGLARGYLGQPGLTAERFVPDAWSGAAGARYYRTGDVARHLDDGQLEFLGRGDQQVKVRGFRVELGEIEAVLGEHPAIEEAVVMARPDHNGETQLAAYFTAPAGTPPSLAELRALLLRRLPEHMVPAAFVRLGALPRLPNGKVDRGALPDPERERMGPMAEFTAPRTPSEEVLAGMWAELFDRERVGVDDDFFELGGHSLLATQLMAWVQKTFHVDLPVRRLFDAPTVAALATTVDAAIIAGEGLAAPPITRAPRGAELPLSFAQRRLWFLDQLQPGGAEFNIAAAVRLSGTLDAEALDRALAEVERRHEVLRTSFPTRDAEPCQRIAAPRTRLLAFTDLSPLPEVEREDEARRLAEADARRPFDLGRGPLLRGSLLRLGDSEHLLLLAMHHIVSDFWSVGILVRELAVLYRAFTAGEPSPLPELPAQYADFAVWQRRWLDGEVLERELAFWRRRLAGGVPELRLPADRPRPAFYASRGAKRALAIDAERVERLRALGRGEGATLFMTVLAVFKGLLRHYSGQDRIAVGTNVANRRRFETLELVGFFVNQLVLSSDLGGDPSFRELLGRVREVALSAYAHQDLPFEKLVEELQPERDLGRPLLFQVKVEVQPAAVPLPALPGLTLTPLEVDRGVVRYDLHLSLAEIAGGLAGWLQYSTDLFDAPTADRIARDFERLLDRVLEDPDARFSALADALAAFSREEEQERLSERRKANVESLSRTRRRTVAGEDRPSL